MNSKIIIIAVIAVGGGAAGAVMLGLQGSDEAICRELLTKSDPSVMMKMKDHYCERYLTGEEILEAIRGVTEDMMNNSPSIDQQLIESEMMESEMMESEMMESEMMESEMMESEMMESEADP